MCSSFKNKMQCYFRSSNNLDDSFESQVASEMDALDDITGTGDLCPENESPPPGVAPPSFPEVGSDEMSGGTLYQSGDHVSCEDLLDFALDRPNSRRTQGRAHGADSDEVHLLLKVLKQEVSIVYT